MLDYSKMSPQSDEAHRGKMTYRHVDPIKHAFAGIDPIAIGSIQKLMRMNKYAHGIEPAKFIEILEEWKQQCVKVLAMIPTLPHRSRGGSEISLTSICFVEHVVVQPSACGESRDGMRTEYSSGYSFDRYLCSDELLDKETELRAWCLGYWQRRINTFDAAIAKVAISPTN